MDCRIQELLSEDEERLRHTLRASETVEKNCERAIDTLSDEYADVLLRYNAACSPDRMRQALADAMTAAARESLAFLKAAGAEKEVSRRETPIWAPLLLLLAVIAAAAAVLLGETQRLILILGTAAAIVAAFLSGRLWFRRQSVSVRPSLDADKLWAAMKRSGETMDRKIDEFCARVAEWSAAGGDDGAGAMREEELQLFGDLLEALYAENGDFALRQLRKLLPCLQALGIETEDYRGDNAELFELFPSKRPGKTLRPALKAGDRLLLSGRATEAEG